MRIVGAMALALATAAVLPAAAGAAIDVTRAADRTITITGDASVDTVMVDRADDGRLRVTASGTGAAVSSADATCTVDPAAPTVATCDAPVRASVNANLGTSTDTLALDVSGTIRMTDTSSTDTIDMSRANDGVRVRWNATLKRLTAACGGCEDGVTVQLPARPGRVITGDERDDVDLRTWMAIGTTTWSLGEDNDRFFGSPRHRSIVNAGDGRDSLVSFAPADVLRGDGGPDLMADFGGSGDLMQGGGDIDALSSMDGRRDVLDGQGGRDMCLSKDGHEPPTCDATVRRMEDSRYLPLTTQAWVFRMLGIR